MNLPINHELSIEGIISSSSIETIRGELAYRIQSNDKLSAEQQSAVLEELDVLLEYEKYRRMLTMIYQLKQDSRDRLNNERDRIRLRRESLISKRQEHRHELLFNRKKAALRIAKINADIGKFRPQLQVDKDLKRTHGELNKIKLKSRLRRALQDEAEKELRNRVMRKAQFLKKVRQQFPDMEEELMDEYEKHHTYQFEGRD